MGLIDRYVYAVTRYLSKDSRADVTQELNSNIEDMLPENASEKDIRRVLQELGDPAKLANEYRQVKRYLIGPSLYDSYISMLKLVTGIIAIVLACITLLNGLLIPPTNIEILDLGITVFVDTLIAVIQGVMQAFLWVTLVFAILERIKANEGQIPFMKKEWSPDDLPPLPNLTKTEIPYSEIIFALFGTIFFTALLYFAPQLIGVYGKSGNIINLIAPLFVVERLQSYIVFIILLAILNVGIAIYKFHYKYWNLSLAIANAFHNLLLSILVFVMISDISLFNQVFILYFANSVGIAMTEFMSIWSRVLSVFVVVFVAINIWDGVLGFIKSKK